MVARKRKPSVETAETYDAEAKPGFNPDESPLNWLGRRKLITREELEAGERLRADFTFAKLSPRVTASWSGVPADRSARRSAPGAGLELRDRVIAARQRFNRALKAVGPEHANILVDVCCYLRGLEGLEREAGWPRRCAKIILQIALQALARHYGIVPPERTGRRGARSGPARIARLRHWGAADYRPVAEGKFERGEGGS